MSCSHGILQIINWMSDGKVVFFISIKSTLLSHRWVLGIRSEIQWLEKIQELHADAEALG